MGEGSTDEQGYRREVSLKEASSNVRFDEMTVRAASGRWGRSRSISSTRTFA